MDSFLEVEFRLHNQRVCIFMNEFMSVLVMGYTNQDWAIKVFQKSVRIWNEEWE